jgi:hypothetical protein
MTSLAMMDIGSSSTAPMHVASVNVHNDILVIQQEQNYINFTKYLQKKEEIIKHFL